MLLASRPGSGTASDAGSYLLTTFAAGFFGSATLLGSIWEQLRTICRINIGGDLNRLIILHDVERWAGLPVVKEIEGFRIVKAALAGTGAYGPAASRQ